MSRTLQMALDALEWLLANIRRNAPELSGKAMGNAEVAITALREALAQPAPEPVMWQFRWTNPGNKPDVRPHELEWQEVVQTNSMYTIEDAAEDLRGYNFDGKPCYEVRPLYAAPPAAPAPAAPVVPLTDTQIQSMWKSSEFRGNGGQADWFCEGIRAAEAHHGITGGKP